MKIKIKDCGVIGDATIKCDGLTVITGKNGSGKSTLVKSVVALMSSLNDCDESLLNDVRQYIHEKIGNYYEYLFGLISGPMAYYDLLPDARSDARSENKAIINKYVYGLMLKNDEYRLSSLGDAIAFLHSLLNEYNQNLDLLESFFSSRKRQGVSSRRAREWGIWISAIPSVIQKAIDYLSNNLLEEKYLFESTKSLLDYTFSGQLIPYNRPGAQPEVKIESDSNWISYLHNEAVSSNFYTHGFRYNCFYIDDGNAIDEIDGRRIKKRTKIDEGLISPSYYPLRDKLLLAISSSVNVFSAIENKEKYANVYSLLDRIWPHSLSRKRGITINADKGLCVANEASGVKIFIILKTLLTRGKIDEKTLLIFDEPENHLHPEWQNKFAEIVTTICRDIGAKIICITHSPSMLLALDVYSKLLEIRDRFSCYFGDIANQTAYFEDVSESIEKAHDKMNEPYIWMDLQDNDFHGD